MKSKKKKTAPTLLATKDRSKRAKKAPGNNAVLLGKGLVVSKEVNKPKAQLESLSVTGWFDMTTGKADLTLVISDNIANAPAGQEIRRPFREVGPDEFLRFPGEKNPFLDIHQYKQFRKHGPEYIRLKFNAEGVVMTPELIWMLDSADLLYNYYERVQPFDGELEVLKYASTITIWNYLSATGYVRIHDTAFNSAPPIYIPPRWPEEEGVWFVVGQGRDGLYVAEADKRRITAQLVLQYESFKADNCEVAEFAGMVAALKACKEKHIKSGIYTDSEFAVKSINNDPQGLYFTDKDLTPRDRQLIEDAIQWLQANPDHNKCKKWDDAWGPIEYYRMGDMYYSD